MIWLWQGNGCVESIILIRRPTSIRCLEIGRQTEVPDRIAGVVATHARVPTARNVCVRWRASGGEGVLMIVMVHHRIRQAGQDGFNPPRLHAKGRWPGDACGLAQEASTGEGNLATSVVMGSLVLLIGPPRGGLQGWKLGFGSRESGCSTLCSLWVLRAIDHGNGSVVLCCSSQTPGLGCWMRLGHDQWLCWKLCSNSMLSPSTL